MTPNNGLKPGRQRIRPFKSEKSRDFLEPVRIGGKIDTSIDNRQYIYRVPDGTANTRTLVRRTVSPPHFLQKRLLIAAVMQQHWVVNFGQDIQKLVPQPTFICGDISPEMVAHGTL